MQGYVDVITKIITDFQYIEEALRLYLSEAYTKIKERMKGELSFKYNYEGISKDALGKLIYKFEKINDNQNLIKELKELNPYRNNIIHRGLLLTVGDLNDKLLIAFTVAELNKLYERTNKALSGVVAEIKKIKE